jgi:DNA polymerase II small subunit
MRDLRTVCQVDSIDALSKVAVNFESIGPREYCDGDVIVLKDITGSSHCVGSIDGFSNYFMDRFTSVRGMLQKRRDMSGSTTISRVSDPNRMMVEKEIKIIGIVNEVKETKTGDHIIEIEDETGRITVMLGKDAKGGNDSILNDEIVGIIGKPARRGGGWEKGSSGTKMTATEIVRPDVPISSGMPRTDSTSIIGFMSDVHVGSKTFLSTEWERMMDWLKTDAVDLGLNYLLFPGDVVDGIGIYPDQEKELDVDDIYEQYHVLSEYLKEIPDSIRVIVQPGNHDAVRPAEPQPAFEGDFAKMFDSNAILIGNPCYLKIEGRTILSYHGKSFDDLMSSVKGLNYSKPIEAMKEMLKRRHMAPMYGGKTPLAPEPRDMMVIDTVPDIFVTGHVHGAGLSHYKGVRLINASTWQSQTSFQKMHNFSPDPAKLFLVHLGTGETDMQSFTI